MSHGRKPTFSGKNVGKVRACHSGLDRLALLENVRDVDPKLRLGFSNCALVHTFKFLDSTSRVRLANDWRVATISFPMQEKNICSSGSRRFLGNGKIDKSRAKRTRDVESRNLKVCTRAQL